MEKHENMVFLATNGDSVGDHIGNAIASDDHEGLKNITSSVKNGHSMIEQWVVSHGGEVVISSGDENILTIPQQALDELEQVKDKYSELSGVTLTIGIGSSMSEAAKALIYGKMNGKDQIVEYSPEMDEQISGSGEVGEGEGEEIPSSESIDHETQEDEQSQNGMEEGQPGIETSEEEQEQAAEDEMAHEQEIPGDHEGFSADTAQGTLDADQQDELGADIGQEEFPPTNDDSDLEENVDDIVGDDQEGIEDESSMPDESEEMMEDEDNQEGDDKSGAISDMMHANMGDEEGEGQLEEDGVDPEQEELRQDVAAALAAFKQNKTFMEQAKQSDPRLYEATILMLDSMIRMAKKLNIKPEQEAEKLQATDSIPEADSMPMEEDENAQEEMPGQEQSEEELEEEAPQIKKPIGKPSK
jgi:hypothetical protein